MIIETGLDRRKKVRCSNMNNELFLYLYGKYTKEEIMSVQSWNWELIGIALGIVASVFGGVWFIINKAFGVGQFSHRVDEQR